LRSNDPITFVYRTEVRKTNIARTRRDPRFARLDETIAGLVHDGDIVALEGFTGVSTKVAP